MLAAILLLATSASAVQTVFPWYPNTFPGAVYFDSTTYVPEIQWADGSTSTTAVQGGVQNVYISTVPGPTGPTGPQGPQGATGGIQYVSASTSSVGWFVNTLACNGSSTTYTLSYVPSSGMGIFCYLNGAKLTQGTDYAYSFPYTITLSTPAAPSCADLECDYTVNTSTSYGVMFSSSAYSVYATSAGFAGYAVGAGTAGSLGAAPTVCTLPNVALGIAANGNASCSTPTNTTGSASLDAAQLVSVAAATTTIYQAINSTASALTTFQSQTITNFGNVATSTANLNSIKASSGTNADITALTKTNISMPSGLTASSGTFNGSGGLGVTYGINATTAAFSGGLTAASGTFTNSGASSFSVQTSSGIDMTAGLLQVASQAGNKCASFDANGNLYGTGSSCGSGGGGLSSIQVGTVPATANSIPSSVAISTGAVGFDQNFFAISTNAVVSLSTSGAAHLPTRTTLTSGSGTYTPPSGAVQLKVRMVGGGGGGAAAYPTVASNAGNASDTVFNSVHAAGGLGGANENSGNASGGGAGGTGGSGTASFRAPGGPGGAGPNENGSDGAQMPSNFGGSSLLGGGAYPNGNFTGNNALANTGGGGVGGTGTLGGGGGGGGGEYVELIINNPTTAGYTYSVSTGAAGGTGTGASGGNGGSGIIIIDEYYSPVTFGAQVNSTNTWTAPQAFQAAVQFDSVSISTLLGITPTAVGQMYYCNNCSPLKAVISTGTAAGNFATPDGGQFK